MKSKNLERRDRKERKTESEGNKGAGYRWRTEKSEIVREILGLRRNKKDRREMHILRRQK